MTSTPPAGLTSAVPSPAAPDPTAELKPGIPIRVLGAIAGSVVLSLAVFGIATASGATWLVTTPTAPDPIRIEAGQIVLSLAVPMMLVGALLWWLGRTRPGLVSGAAWIGLAAGVLTAGMPFSATTDLPTALALGVMHAIAGILWFVALRAGRRATQPVKR